MSLRLEIKDWTLVTNELRLRTKGLEIGVWRNELYEEHQGNKLLKQQKDTVHNSCG